MEKDYIPKVSIGLAVFNGEEYLREAVDSILAQTFTDFELIISDNASTDRTEVICREYAAKDSRIRYYRNPTNIGGANNENLTFKLSRGKYFRNAAYDDVLSHKLIEKCVEVLERDSSIILCYSTTVKIDETGHQIGFLKADRQVMSINSYDRLRYLFSFNHECEATYGLIRSDILRKTDLQLNYSDSDRSLLCELSLYGPFYVIPEPLFYKRYHTEMSTSVYPDPYERIAWFNPENFNPAYPMCMRWMQFFHFLRIISRVPLPLGKRLRSYYYLRYWLMGQKKYMAEELFRLLQKSIDDIYSKLVIPRIKSF